MTTTTRTVNPPRHTMPRRMADLLALHTPRPLRTDTEHEHAVELLDQLMRQPRPTRDQRDYAGVLSLVIEAFEREHHDAEADDLSGPDLLRALMEANGLTAGEVADILGVSPALISMVFKGDRSLTWAHAKALGQRFALDPAAFMD